MSVYQVWVRDCDGCGTPIAYGEDESSVPDACEECGMLRSEEEQ